MHQLHNGIAESHPGNIPALSKTLRAGLRNSWWETAVKMGGFFDHRIKESACARHGQVLTGESPECRSISAKHIAKGKGVHREVESEGSRRQTSGLTDRNHIRHDRMGKAASKAEARKLIRNPMVCMWQIDGRKEPVLTRGGLMDA